MLSGWRRALERKPQRRGRGATEESQEGKKQEHRCIRREIAEPSIRRRRVSVFSSCLCVSGERQQEPHVVRGGEIHACSVPTRFTFMLEGKQKKKERKHASSVCEPATADADELSAEKVPGCTRRWRRRSGAPRGCVEDSHTTNERTNERNGEGKRAAQCTHPS